MKVAAVSLVSLLLILGRGDSARVREQFAAPEDIDSVFPVAGGQNVTSSSGLVRYVQLFMLILKRIKKPLLRWAPALSQVGVSPVPRTTLPCVWRRGGAASWSGDAGGRGVTTPPVLMRYRNMDMQNMDLWRIKTSNIWKTYQVSYYLLDSIGRGSSHNIEVGPYAHDS